MLNSVRFTNEPLCKIGYFSNPICNFCHPFIETIPHSLFGCSFSNYFWNEVNDKILRNKLKSCRGLSLTYCDVLVGSLEEEMGLLNYILGKSFLWTCRCRETLPSLCHFIRILIKIEYETEKDIFQNDEFV